MDEQKTVSPNIIDHRGAATHGLTALIALIFGAFFGRSVAPADSDPDFSLIQVVSTALDRGGDFWAARLKDWRPAHVVLVDHDENTACGLAGPTHGPFYCPGNERIYVDLNFLRSIKGELARAYVIAHELGHHVQALRHEIDGRQSIDVELQADCYGGMWMHEESTHGHLAPGDFEAAVTEAAAVGDDKLAPGSAPETWTHGSSAQRAAALEAGFKGGPCQTN